MESKAVSVSTNRHVGGMTSGALTATDIGIGGSHRWPDGTCEPVSFEKLPPPPLGLLVWGGRFLDHHEEALRTFRGDCLNLSHVAT